MSGTTRSRPGPADPDEARKCASWIVAVAATQDREAFAQLFAHFAPRVKAYMFRFGGNSENAEELAQEAMMQVWRKAHLFDPHKAAASTWIFTIARNLRIDRFRQRKHIEVDDSDPTLIIDDSPLADEIVDRDEHAVLVKSAMEELPADQKVVVELSFLKISRTAKLPKSLISRWALSNRGCGWP